MDEVDTKPSVGDAEESKRSLDVTLLVMAYNEASALEATVEECVEWLQRNRLDAPVVILDDGSTDGTDQIADRLAATYPCVSVYHQPENVGQFRNITRGLELAGTTYFAAIPGDGQFEIDSLDLYLPFIGEYDIIFGIPNNEIVRGKWRVVLSHLWRLYLLALFGVSVTYLAGLSVAPVELVRSMKTRSEGFLGWYETMVRVVISGASFIQIPFVMRPRHGGESNAFSPLRNALDLVRMARVWSLIKGPGMVPRGPEFPEIRELYRKYREALNETDS